MYRFIKQHKQFNQPLYQKEPSRTLGVLYSSVKISLRRNLPFTDFHKHLARVHTPNFISSMTNSHETCVFGPIYFLYTPCNILKNCSNSSKKSPRCGK